MIQKTGLIYSGNQKLPEDAELLVKQILAQASRDTEFRSGLLVDPRGTLIGHFDVDVPDGVFTFVDTENSAVEASGIVLRLPDYQPDAELMDVELEAVAGGDDGFWSSVGSGIKSGLKSTWDNLSIEIKLCIGGGCGD